MSVSYTHLECVLTSAGVSSIIGDGSLSLKGEGSLSITATEAAAISVEGSVTAALSLIHI